ncbi:hypothetical protein [Tabrizicola aquatica]|uniref:hypothetical protein n=1 Tax=Tabrizicola aquatica TaxID=909926 RepID=UPI0011AF5B15|nr:hypothetical protein [Tabrizicola aquatica]
MAVYQAFTRSCALAGMLLAALAPAPLRADGFDRLGWFLAGAINRLDAGGALDVTDYTCETQMPGLQLCTDPATGLSFLHLPSPGGANVSLTVVKGTAQDGPDPALPDQASADRLLAAVKALPETDLAGLDRCALLEKAEDTDGLVLGIKPPKGGYPVYLVYGGLDDQARATLAQPGGEGETLSGLLLVTLTDATCTPPP